MLVPEQPSNIMAAKKTAKKTTESAPPAAKNEAIPVAKKVAKKKADGPKTTTKKAGRAAETTITSSAPVRLSPDAIARAAYLNYRRRVEQGLPGDAHGDWLEAESILGGNRDL